jgi:hypothetical protein
MSKLTVTKEQYTKIFLRALTKATDEVNVKHYLRIWWHNTRVKPQGGLRLSDAGCELLLGKLAMHSYELAFDLDDNFSSEVVLFFDSYISCPYYLGNKNITLFQESVYTELVMFAQDIEKFGLMQAMKKQKAAKNS